MPGSGKPFGQGNQASKGHGRPKGSGHVEICKRWAEEKGWQKLIDLADGKGFQEEFVENGTAHLGPDYKVQLDACKILLAYGFGRPTESIDLTSGGQTVTDWARQYFGTIGTNGNGHSRLRQVSREDHS